MENSANLRLKSVTVAVIIKYCLIFLIQIPLSLFSLYGMRPFGTGFFMALCFSGVPVAIIAPIYIFAELAFSLGLYQFLSAIVCVCAMLCVQLVQGKLQKKLFRSLTPIFALVAQSGQFFLLAENYILLSILLSPFLALAFMYACINGIRPVLTEKLKYKLLETEILCLAVILIATVAGLNAITLYGFPLVFLVASFAILLSNSLKGFSSAVAVAFCFGLGCAVTTYNVAYIAEFIFIATVSAIFIASPKFLCSASAILAQIMFMFYFNVDTSNSVLTIVASASGALMFIVLPKKRLQEIKSYYFESQERVAVRYMLNKHRADLSAKLSGTAQIFNSMSHILLDSSKKGEPSLKGVLKAKCCDFCPNITRCEKEGAGFFRELDKMAEATIKNGRLSVSDIPDTVLSKCTQVARLIAVSSELQERYTEQKRKSEYDENAKRLVASQLYGVFNVLESLAISCGKPLSYDKERERVIVEELNYNGIVCAQSLLTEDGIVLIVRSECFEKDIIERVISRLMKKTYKVSGIDDTVLAGFLALTMKNAPDYDMIFGVASGAKAGLSESGDTHSFIKLDESRFMIALCDGMGSGIVARKTSDTAVSLVENFYKTGFDNSLVLDSVNSFLSMTQIDSFSALDIMVVDLNSAKADIIKLGSPATYIKRKNEISRIDGSSLPLGALDSVAPTTYSINLDLGDMVVLSSDGVADSFAGDKLSATVLNLRTANPQSIAEGVLEHTFSNCGGKLKDDSTVIAVKLIKKA